MKFQSHFITATNENFNSNKKRLEFIKTWVCAFCGFIIGKYVVCRLTHITHIETIIIQMFKYLKFITFLIGNSPNLSEQNIIIVNI